MACDYLGFSCTYKVQPQYDNVQDAINRAEFIANIKWQAASSITDASHAYYEGEIVRGLPYSSARELDCFVGIHVSFYTFLTATNNPRSLFYTEDISKPQYNASYLCSVYYGTVCSCAVEYALGMEVPYFTSMIDTQSVFTKPIDQNPENIELCSILWSPGHVVMVTSIERTLSTNQIAKVSILESAGYNTRIKVYSRDEFYSRWRKDGWIIYNYRDLKNRTVDTWLTEDVGIDSYMTVHCPVCPSKGDRSCYREEENVTINILSNVNGYVKLYKDDKYECSYKNIVDDLTLTDLQVGEYRVELYDENVLLGFCTFLVVDTDVKLEDKGKFIRCHFNSENSQPNYVTFCTLDGMPLKIVEVGENERIIGFEDKKKIDVGEYYCKAMFKSKFGQISNYPIKVIGNRL